MRVNVAVQTLDITNNNFERIPVEFDFCTRDQLKKLSIEEIVEEENTAYCLKNDQMKFKNTANDLSKAIKWVELTVE